MATLACAFLSLLWAFAATPAHAQAKSRGKIAILGLEVEDKSGAPITEEATKVAKELTRALRNRADTPPTPYALAPNADKELIDEKLMNGCNDEAPTCMAKIAENMKADHLLWGKIERAKNPSNKSEDGYKVTLTLLKVATKQTSTYSGFLPLSQKGEAGIKTISKEAYGNLSKSDAQGTLVVKTNVERGTILVDGQPAGSITNNRGEASLPEGSYKVAVSADGYRTFDLEDNVTIEAGKSETRTVDLTKLDNLIDRSGSASTRKSYTGWKIAAGAGFAVAAGGAAWLIQLNVTSIADYKDNPGAVGPAGSSKAGEPLGSGDCGDYRDSAEGPGAARFKTACGAYRNTWFAGGIIGIGAVVGFGSLFYVLTRDGEPTTERAVGRTKKRPNIAITPIVTPSVGGATFRIDW